MATTHINGSSRSGMSGGYSYLGPASEGHTLGFRVAAVPEPGALALAMLSGGLLLIGRRR